MDPAASKFTMTDAAASNGEGNGLRGMRERVEMLGGTLNRTTEAGTTLIDYSAPQGSGRRNDEGCQN